MKMFQLKMYMAISGWAPERGSGHIGGSSPPDPAPRLSRKSVLFLRYRVSLNERITPPTPLPSPRAAILCHL